MEEITSHSLLGPLRPWLEDPAVREIIYNPSGAFYLDRSGRLERVSAAADGLCLSYFLRLIANESRCVFNSQNPLLSATLRDGSRVQAVCPPVSKSLCFSIRKHLNLTVSLPQLISSDYIQMNKSNSMPSEEVALGYLKSRKWLTFLEYIIQKRFNILISGKTGSGKTTLLSALLSQTGAQERTIILEDTRELPSSDHNRVGLLSQQSLPGGGIISLSDLLKVSLRLRPDRLVLGEIRGSEAYDFINACQTGHGGSLASIHAGSPAEAICRLSQLFLTRAGSSYSLAWAESLVAQVVDCVIQLSRHLGRPAITGIFFQGESF